MAFFCAFNSAKASVADMFGASTQSLGLAGQASGHLMDASNNYYNPAMIALTDKSAFSFNSFIVGHSFHKINNIAVNTSINSEKTSAEYGSMDMNYPAQALYSIHGNFKLFKNGNNKIGFSFFSPIDKFTEVDSGDSFRPEYVMYRSRYKRSMANINFAVKKSEKLSWSFGLFTGIQSSGRSHVVARENGSAEPTNGKIKFNATPSVTPTFSFFYKLSPQSYSYFTFQNEMKSNFKNNAKGLTPIGASSLKFNWDISALVYYDPRIYRLGYGKEFNNYAIKLCLEYQDWSGYKTPKLQFAANSGSILTGGKEYEVMKTQNILIPKIAFEIPTKKSNWYIGYFFKQSPLKNNLNEAGNSLDTDVHSLSFGRSSKVKLLNNDFKMHISSQVNHLVEKKVTKTNNQEDNTSGVKIGAPGYKVGGTVFVVSFGLSWVL